ncbi:MAG: hypothetical protein HPY71_05055 [Firmicutes bacterium]|nr:hypothetical protein [Bacillota bacterium]
MILYTVLSPEEVLDGMDKPRTFLEVELEGVKMTIEPISNEEARLVRIFSTDPRDYLDPLLQPGSTIRFSPAHPRW